MFSQIGMKHLKHSAEAARGPPRHEAGQNSPGDVVRSAETPRTTDDADAAVHVKRHSVHGR